LGVLLALQLHPSIATAPVDADALLRPAGHDKTSNYPEFLETLAELDAPAA
jgi:hypothetical protein